MIPPRVVASLISFVGICMIAGWLSAFRNRAYLGWLGLAFVTFGGSLLAADKGGAAQVLGASGHQFMLWARVLFVTSMISGLLAAISAVQETRRRLRELQQRHRDAAQAILELTKAQLDKEAEGDPDKPNEKSPPDEGRT